MGFSVLIPTMKPTDMPKAEKPAEKVEETPVSAPVEQEEKIDFSKVEIEPLFADFVDFETFSKSDFRAVKVLNCEAVKKSKKLLKFTLDDGTGTERTILSGIHAYYEPEALVGKTLYGVEIKDGDDFAKLFLEKGLVAVVPGSGFGAPNYVRWSFAVSMENIKEGLDRLEKFLADA